MSESHPGSRPDMFVGRVLSYCDSDDVDRVYDLVSRHPRSGLVVRGKNTVRTVARLRNAGLAQPLVVDVAAWSKAVATPRSPMQTPGDDGLFPIGLDQRMAGISAEGADVVLTPSLFVRSEDWAALRAVVRAGRAVSQASTRILVATEAAMLDTVNRQRFIDTIAGSAGGHPVAFVFANRSEPLANRGRSAGLREVLARIPGCFVVATEVLTAMDVAVRGGSAAVGLSGSLRRPQRPWDKARPPAKGWIPGLFLRELWENRSPSVYADWFANSPSPTCEQCDGRAVDRFTTDPLDKDQVLRHNVHAWLDVLSEIDRRRPNAARDWLNADRCRGFAAHAELNSAGALVGADRLLRELCELDDPQGRRASPTGHWR